MSKVLIFMSPTKFFYLFLKMNCKKPEIVVEIEERIMKKMTFKSDSEKRASGQTQLFL
jgi:hypothetical protein